ncbi:arylamine N-acetyltransferase [Peribacillus muralis]|uniref:arylamine N-acetyltransferase family protein n=1 Tax=Peribacillus muralis TaxID=264697 RepID=UPI001F4E89BC|nr:arylamine N-acetyltransferase [Peribacillus muralis]MCK1993269.1 arylamine N-acetyltransferase [Peribacillus muralis]MCK2013823.1 arylamine N-acetyltransferase [Peribacillus muralis]
MNDLNALFRKRIGIKEGEKLTFQGLDDILERIAKTIPFENLAIIASNLNDINKENIINKVLVRNEGGVCYELNAALYFFLADNDFEVTLFRGVIYNQGWTTIGRTHVTILLNHDGQTYLVDTGFGGNLPLKPVPLNGETVISPNGEFRIKKVNTEHGNYILELKLKYKDPDWKIGYAFDSSNPVGNVAELNEVQTIISEDPQSPFNKHRLITRLTNSGNITLTDTSFTRWVDGKVTKEEIDGKQFNELMKQHFDK